jgi:hypothetical protein
MGEGRKSTIRMQFNPSLRLPFHGADITSDAGLLAYRDLDIALLFRGDAAFANLNIHDYLESD